MKCRDCTCSCDVWYYPDGGIKGVECSQGHTFYSEEYADFMHKRINEFVTATTNNMEFPKDGQTYYDYLKKLKKGCE